MEPLAIEEVTLQEPLTEFTAQIAVDIFDGNLFLVRVGWNGERDFRVGIAGPESIGEP
jgi:hypothetical protein